MEDDDLIPLSALQHYLYCPRQCALIHIERMWAENLYTAEGRLMHERADQPKTEQRHGVRTVTAMPLVNHSLGIAGIADVVEFHQVDENFERIQPVEYKRGRPKKHRADEVQLCAQGLCLEAMFNQQVVEGVLFYGKTRRRKIVPFDDDMRAVTMETIRATRALIESCLTPKIGYQSDRCDACSLIDLCQPHLLGSEVSVSAWLAKQLEE